MKFPGCGFSIAFMSAVVFEEGHEMRFFKPSRAMVVKDGGGMGKRRRAVVTNCFLTGPACFTYDAHEGIFAF